MTENKRLNADELAEIRKRVEKVYKGNMFREVEVLSCNNKVVMEDVPKLLAEIERLRGALKEIADTGESYHEHYCRDIAKEALEHDQD